MKPRYRMLGTVSVIIGAGEDNLGPKAGLVLSRLLADRRRVVSSDALVFALWGDTPPADPGAALHTHISRLRTLVGEDLVTKAPGYMLAASQDRVDADRFEQAIGAARAAENPVAAIEEYERALGEWHGEPFAGRDEAEAIREEAIRLTALHEDAAEERLALLVETGAPQEALPGLEALRATAPLRERPWAILMTALARLGRKADAIRAFSDFKELLGEETGLEPSAGLRELELAILFDQLDAEEPATATPVPVPLQISFLTGASGRKIATGRVGSGPRLLVHPAWLCKLDLLAAGMDGRSSLVSRLAERFEVVVFDRGGTGMSRHGAPDLSFSASVEELIEVAESTGPAVLLAASAAGPIGVAAAVRAPQLLRGLVLVGTYADGPATFPPHVVEAMDALVRLSWGMGSHVLASLLFPGAGAEMLEGFARYQREAATPETAAELLRQMYDADVQGILDRVEVPSLVIHYRGDKAVPFTAGETLARGIPGATLLPLDGVSHLPTGDDMERVLATLAAFATSL